MKIIFRLFAILMLLAFVAACSEKSSSSSAGILDEISGVWRAKGDGTMVSIIYAEKKVRLLFGDNSVPVSLGEVDNTNKTANMNVMLKNGKPGVWTIRQIWDKEKTSFHLQLTLHDGTQDELSFVRKISADDLNQIANAEARTQPGSIGDAAKAAEAVAPATPPVQAQPIGAAAPTPPVSNNPQASTEIKSQTVTPLPVTNPTMAVLAMIAAAKNENNAAILSAKVTLDSFPKPDRGDRKLAREKNKLGLDALKENAYESAIARLNEGVAADPSDVELKNNLGYALMMAGKLDYAKKTLIESLALDSARGAAWANLGQTLAKQGDEDSAVAAFVNTFIFSRAQNKTVEFLTNLSQSDPDPSVKSAAAKALEAPLMKGVAVINK